MKHLILLVYLVVSLSACTDEKAVLRANNAAKECISKTSAYVKATKVRLAVLKWIIKERHDTEDEAYNQFVNTAKDFLEDDLKALQGQLGNLGMNCVLLVYKKFARGEKADLASIVLAKRDCESSRRKHEKRVYTLELKVDHLMSLKKYYDRFGHPKAKPVK
jgi:hypothetical protein